MQRTNSKDPHQHIFLFFFFIVTPGVTLQSQSLYTSTKFHQNDFSLLGIFYFFCKMAILHLGLERNKEKPGRD